MSIITLTRRIKSAAIIIVLTALSSSTTTQAQVGLKSDLNGDGIDNVSDVSYHIGLLMGRVNDPAVDAGMCPNSLHPHVIDLGLPSGIKWTCCNVGAESPTHTGGYFAWGETLTKDTYSQEAYYHYDKGNSSYILRGDDITKTIYDVASVRWGDDFGLPSKDNIDELLNNCTSQWTSLGGVSGLLVTATNGKKIFLPAAGQYSDATIYYSGSYGYYWTSTQSPTFNQRAYGLTFWQREPSTFTAYRYNGFQVRPVKLPDVAVTQGLCPDENHPHDINLNLPSGTKWTCCNIGAKSPKKFGDYYAWAETSTKDYYSVEYYAYWDASGYTNIGDDIAGTKYDVATARLGQNYTMPTEAQVEELVANCSAQWTAIDEVYGTLFTATNGNKIFLPAQGLRGARIHADVGKCGYYWTSTIYSYEYGQAYYLKLSEKGCTDQMAWYVYNGYPIRPVRNN